MACPFGVLYVVADRPLKRVLSAQQALSVDVERSPETLAGGDNYAGMTTLAALLDGLTESGWRFSACQRFAEPSVVSVMPTLASYRAGG